MSYVSIYRKFRPDTFDKVVGQDHIARTLKNIIKTDKIGHAYLFTGTRGTGKTSCAKIFAKAVNCLNPKDGSPCNECEVCKSLTAGTNLDVIELDAASNNSVDDIRAIKESLQFPPAMGKFKVYIIDEVHMLTTSAFNALLKSLEEPPSYVIFILATTEAHKLPETILSRCVRFDFRLLSVEVLIDLLKKIFDNLNYKYEEKALREIALGGQGSVRDTLSIADMCMSFAPNGLTFGEVMEVLGAQEFNTVYDLAVGILNGKVSSILRITQDIYKKGKGISTVNKEIIDFFRELLTIKNISTYRGNFSSEEFELVKMLSEKHDNYKLSRILEIMASVENQLRYSTMPLIVFEATLVKASQLTMDVSNEGLLSRIKDLETKIEDTNFLEHISNKIVSEDTKISTNISNPIIENVVNTLEAIEESEVFEEEIDGNTEQALNILNSIIIKLKENKFVFLAQSLSEIEKASYLDNILTLKIEDEVNMSLIKEDRNFNLIEAILREIKGDKNRLILEDGLKKKKENLKDIQDVVELFGNKLKKR